MSNPRHRAREVALQILYRYDVNSVTEPAPEGAMLASDLSRHFDHFQVPDNLRGFAAELVAGTLQEKADLDGLIEAQAKNWKVARMGSVERSLLRMAIYEMRHYSDIPRNVTIDEAVELAKQFGNAETPAFINGILDAVPLT